LDLAVPASKIASLSSGEFVGMVADDPDQKIDLKAFHSEILRITNLFVVFDCLGLNGRDLTKR
jgi:hypothetical protein